MLIHNFLENSAARNPDKIAVLHDDQRVTYNSLNSRADDLAANLKANGIAKGDRIVLLMENSVDYTIAYYATLKASAVVAPLNPGLKPDGLQYLLNELEPSAIITNFKSERLLKATDLNAVCLKLIIIQDPKQKWENSNFRVQTLEESTKKPTNSISPNYPNDSKDSITPDDLSSIIYTSGSTGKPKGVMLSHSNIVSNTNSICQYLHITDSDVQMVVLPFFYVMGKSLLNTHIAAGGSVVINNRFIYPADVVKQMAEEKVTSFSGVPSTYAYLLNRSPLPGYKDKLSALRYCSQAGGHMAKSIKLALRDSLPAHTQIVIMYGATEAAARLTYLDPEFFESKIESIGKPIPNVTINILNKHNSEMPNGEEGYIVSQGPNIMMGYWKDPQATTQVLTKHGYHTGDIGYRDEEGFLYVKGRKDGLLKVSGHRLNPIEVEDFLLSTGLLIETAVLGLADDLQGNKLVALIVPNEENCSAEELMEKCAGNLPNHKCPSAIINVRALPKNANGKIDREKCIQLALKHLTNISN